MLDFIQPYSDSLLMICSFAFGLSLVPQVLFNFKNKICEITYTTSVPTTVFMAVITLVYISNDFWLSTIMGSVTTVMWATIAIQRYIYDH
jgi:hypothetical protein